MKTWVERPDATLPVGKRMPSDTDLKGLPVKREKSPSFVLPLTLAMNLRAQRSATGALNLRKV